MFLCFLHIWLPPRPRLAVVRYQGKLEENMVSHFLDSLACWQQRMAQRMLHKYCGVRAGIKGPGNLSSAM